MSSRIDILAPATITVLGGSLALSSEPALPPGGIVLAGPPAGGTLSVQLVAANPTAGISASSLGGATVGSHANTLSLSGSLAQINAALATLQITEPPGAATDTLYLTASGAGLLSGSTAIAVNIPPAGGPAFVNPPASLTLLAGQLQPITGLQIGDPSLTGLDQAGLGAQELLSLTLSAASGILLLPGFTPLGGVAATGLGTGSIILDFSGDQLNAVNQLLAGLQYVGPPAQSGLAYSLRNVSGPLGPAATNGNIALTVTGPAPPPGTLSAGSQSVITGDQSLAAGATLAITNSTGQLGDITGAGALYIAPDAALNLPYNALALGGVSLDYGLLTAGAFTETGSLIISQGSRFSGAVTLGPAALIDFNGTLIADGGALVANELAISLAAGAVLAGNGLLIAGNFSEAGRITGPGTILATGGETLVIAADSIGNGAQIQADAGAVVMLGPVDPLYGIFDATPLTIDNSVTLAFAGAPGADQIAGGYADTLGQNGGVFVISGPAAFDGTITGFTPGDRLIFPGLTNLSLFNVTGTSFEVAGDDSQGIQQIYTFHASYQSGAALYTGVDLQGDGEVSLRDPFANIFVNGGPISITSIEASAGVAQPVQGLTILPAAASTQPLELTLSVSHGMLSDGALGPAATLSFSAPNATILNQELAGLTYTGTGVKDALSFSSHGGYLNGLSAIALIDAPPPGTIAGFGPFGASEAQTVLFAAANPAPLGGEAAPGRIIVSALTDFADALIINGIAGTALLVDHGATALFDAAANVVTGADVIIGDAGGAGTLSVFTQNFLIGGNQAGNLTLAANAAAAGSAAIIAGTVGINGALVVGQAAAAALSLSGGLAATTASIATAGTLTEFGAATASFGKFIDAGTVYLFDTAQAAAATFDLSGALSLGGTADFNVTGAATIDPGASLLIGADADFTAPSLVQSGGSMIDSGRLGAVSLVSSGAISLAGGTIAAASLALLAGASLTGFGIIENAAAGFSNAGLITAAGGLLTIGGDLANAGAIAIAAGASLDIVHGLAGGTVSFTGSNAALTINDVGVFTARVGNMAGHDVIDLIGDAPAHVKYANGSITVTDTAGLTLGGFALALAGGQPAVQIVSDNHGGALVTLGDEMPCFARGTRLLTPGGYRPVEALAPGDPLITRAGDRRPIRWIGRRTLDLAERADGRPVIIAANAFGPGVPARLVRLSPLHAVFAGGVLVPALHLVNGATITRAAAGAAVTYYHIELDRHDIVLADGLACETYYDNGNRGPLYHEAGTRTPARLPCARLVTSGPALAALRRRLHHIALAAGFTLTYAASLRAIAGARSVLPEITLRRGQRVARFQLPPAATGLTLLSHSASPAETDPDSEDRRELGICLALNGRNRRAIRQLGTGWHPPAPGDQGIWMGRVAALEIARPATTLALTLAAVVQSWRAPVDSTRMRP